MSQNSALSAHLPTPERALARKGAMPRAVVREDSVISRGVTDSFRLLPDGGPDLVAVALEAFDGLERLTPFDANDTVYVRRMKEAREAVDRLRSKQTPPTWDVDNALERIGRAIFSSFEVPPPTKHDDERTARSKAIARQSVKRNKPPSAKATVHLPDNVLDRSGAKAIYAARRKAAG